MRDEPRKVRIAPKRMVGSSLTLELWEGRRGRGRAEEVLAQLYVLGERPTAMDVRSHLADLGQGSEWRRELHEEALADAAIAVERVRDEFRKTLRERKRELRGR